MRSRADEGMRGDLLAAAVLTALFLLVVVLLPVRLEIPLIDDWSTYRTIEAWRDTGSLHYLGWHDPTYIGLYAWGGLLAALFGLSFTTLRISTLVLSWVGVLSLFGILRRLGTARPAAILGACVLLFNPIYLLLSFSSNADVPYFALSTLAIWLLLRALDGSGRRSLLYTGMAVAGAYLVRQQGLLLLAGATLVVCRQRPVRRVGDLLLAVWPLVLPVAAAVALHAYVVHASGDVASMFGRLNKSVVLSGGESGTPLGVLRHLTLQSLASLLTIGLLLLPLALGAESRKRAEGDRRVHIPWGLLLLTIMLIAGAMWQEQDKPRSRRGWPFLGNLLDALDVYPRGALRNPWGGWNLLRLGLSFASILVMAILLSRAWRAARRARATDGSGRAGAILGLGAMQWFPSMTLVATYERYVLPLIPGFIAVSLAGRALRRRSLVLMTAGTVLLAGLSLEWTRANLRRGEAWWMVAESLMRQGASPAEIVVGLEWEGYHLFRPEMVRRREGRNPAWTGPYPWTSLVYATYAVTEDVDEMEPAARRTFRPFLSVRRREVGYHLVGGREVPPRVPTP